MRKSSLGRRSSTHIPVRVPSLGGSASRSCQGKKSTGNILKPGFSQGRRSQSADRESCGSYGGRPLQRANTIGAMTPITPRHTSVHGSLPTGSARAPKSQMVSTDSARRMSSFGGGGKRKDTRPIAEKSFQQAAQAKVQEYFDLYACDVIGPGNSIRPMNTKLFVDMINHLLQNLDSKMVISKSNYLEEIPQHLRKLGYRSKVDRSWLMTVNTPHSWQHVIAVLSWLVDLKELMDLTDPFELIYPNAVDDQTEENEEDEEEEVFNIDKEMVFHLKRSYQMRKSDEDRLALLDEEYLEKQIIDLKCTDEDLDTLQRQIDLIKEEVENETHRKTFFIDDLQKIKEKDKAAIEDIESMREYIEKSKAFVESVGVKLATTDKEIIVKRAALEKKKEDLQKIQDQVNTQQISRDEIEKFNSEKNNLQRMIKFYESTIREYQNSTFNVDMKLAEDQKKLEKLVLEYNKLVAEKTVLEPQLKICEIKLQLLTEVSMLETIDSNLKLLKEKYKSTITELESQKQDCESTLKWTNDEKDKTMEEINKESRLLEIIECDYEKHKESSTKETEKLKENLNRCQQISKDISEQLSHFDPAKLEDKRQQLKMLEHDYVLVQKRSKEYLAEVLEMVKENVAEIAPVVATFMGKVKKIEDTFL